MLADSKAKVSSVLAGDLIVKDYFTSVLGAPALNMGVFVGIITGFLELLYITNIITIINCHRH